MATETSRKQCIKCGKEKSTSKCAGCSQDFCYNHLTEHRQELSGQLDEIEMNRDIFRQTLNEQINNPEKYFLINQIDEWEEDSIRKIQRTAKECREILFQYITEHIKQIGINLTKLTDQLREIRRENDFNEIHLYQFKHKLTQLSKELDNPSNISIQQDSTSFINRIFVLISSQQLISSYPHINLTTKWKETGITIAGGNKQGNQLNQLALPHGIYVDDDNQWIYIADCYNHRIVKWKYNATDGEIVAGGNGDGNRMDQLNCPRDIIVDRRNDSLIICDWGNRRVLQRSSRRNDTNSQILIPNIDCYGLTIDNNGDLYVSDCVKNEVRRWTIGDNNGTLVAGGNGRGNNFNQFNYPTYIFVDQDYSIYISDLNNHRVMKWMKGAAEGTVVAGGQGQGNNLTQLSYPYGVIVDHLGNVYVADSYNHRIVCWLKGSKEGGIIVGRNRTEKQPNQCNYFRGLSFDRQGNLYAVDNGNHRVDRFDIN